MYSRDGADDFYEAFFNWPHLYVMGGTGPFAEPEITGGSYTRADPVSLGPWQGHRLPAAAPVTETPFTGAGPWLMVELPPSTRIRLRLNIRLRTRVP